MYIWYTQSYIKKTQTISSILLYISGDVLLCLEYQSKHTKLHQGLDIVYYLWFCIDFDYITLVLKVKIMV